MKKDTTRSIGTKVLAPLKKNNKEQKKKKQPLCFLWSFVGVPFFLSYTFMHVNKFDIKVIFSTKCF